MFGDSGESLDFRPADQVEHKRFDAITLMVGGQNILRSVFLPCPLEKSVPLDTRRLFGSFLHLAGDIRDVFFIARKDQAVSRAEIPQEPFVLITLQFPEAVVEMGDDDGFLRVDSHDLREEVHAVRTSGTGDH